MATLENAVPTTTEIFNIDASHSEVGFAVKHLMVSTVRGRFGAVTGSIQLDNENIERSSVDVTIDATSIDTRTEQRDAHLRSPDFFDVEKYPSLTFKSTKVEAKGSDLRVTGDLTIRDVTKSVVLDVEQTGRGKDPWGGERVGFAATTKINRDEFGLTWNAALETGGVVVSNEVKINLEVEAVLA